MHALIFSFGSNYSRLFVLEPYVAWTIIGLLVSTIAKTTEEVTSRKKIRNWLSMPVTVACCLALTPSPPSPFQWYVRYRVYTSLFVWHSARFQRKSFHLGCSKWSRLATKPSQVSESSELSMAHFSIDAHLRSTKIFVSKVYPILLTKISTQTYIQSLFDPVSYLEKGSR